MSLTKDYNDWTLGSAGLEVTAKIGVDEGDDPIFQISDISDVDVDTVSSFVKTLAPAASKVITLYGEMHWFMFKATGPCTVQEGASSFNDITFMLWYGKEPASDLVITITNNGSSDVSVEVAYLEA